MDMRRLSLIALALALLLAAAPVAHAQGGAFDAAAVLPDSMTERPAGFGTDGNAAMAVAARRPEVRAAQRAHPDAALFPLVFGGVRWEVDLMAADGQRKWAEVDVSPDGRVLAVYTGVAAEAYIARGHFNAQLRRPWVWLALAGAFLVPFVDPRRLRRMLHLDLLALLAFGVSYALFEQGRADAAVLAIYPPLLYLLGRLLAVGLRRRRRAPAGRLVPVLPAAALAVGVVALFGARVALNVTSDRVIDVGQASAIGADRILHAKPLYVANDSHGDTYGPVAYIAYTPFAGVFGVEDGGRTAAHAAAIAFDALTLVGLVLLGLRLRAGPEGRRLGLALAWAWAAFPFTVLGVAESTNDGLVALLLVATLLALSSAPARGAWLGLATAAKFLPGALLPLLARGTGDGRRAALTTTAACAGVFAFAMALHVPAGGVRELWDCTLGYQLTRTPDFSIWVLAGGLGWLKTALVAGAALLAVAVAVVPGRRSIVEIAALAGAVTIAWQLPAGHWFYFYIMWFTPLALVAWFVPLTEPALAAVAAPGACADAADEPGALALAG
jgi:hypothetical protein